MSVSIKQHDVDRLVNVSASLAATSGARPREYLVDLVNRADLPPRWVNSLADIWTGNTNIDARKLIRWAIAKDVNPNDRRFTTLGSILKPLFEEEVGFENACLIVSLIIVYGLYRDENLLENLRRSYQVPIPASSVASKMFDYGPEINWQGPNDEVKFQSLFKPEPNLLDVGFLMQVIRHAVSVCRIEIPEQVPQGTGFLIAPNLLLTNYHVLKPAEDTDIDTSVCDTILRFGCFSSSTGPETEGQTFRLVRDQPILQQSPTNQLDYVLLQVENSITQAKDISPAAWEHENLPRERMDVNILQHPDGASMKIAISSNGITGVYQASNRMQYVTRTSSGSSGSPCFNKDWKVVALHHAQRAKYFGLIREGILFSSIYEQVKAHLE